MLLLLLLLPCLLLAGEDYYSLLGIPKVLLAPLSSQSSCSER